MAYCQMLSPGDRGGIAEPNPPVWEGAADPTQTAGTARPSGPPAAQCRLEIREQIAPVLHPDRESHQAVGDAGSREFLGRESRMRRRLRMAHQCFDATERNGIAGEPQAAQEIECRRLAALQLDREHRS